MQNPFNSLKRREWVLWTVSLVVTVLSNIIGGNVSPVNLAATSVGVTALIFVAKGDVWGQILTVLFSILYAIVSYEQRYYGEMITYLGMTMPIAVMSVVSWLKNPYEKGKNVVKIHHLTVRQKIMAVFLSAVVTAIFYFILKAFDTPVLLVSTVSITTSFVASYLTFYRNSYYALAYAANDAVLIVLWVIASFGNTSYISMVACFLMFFINDMYGFVSWKRREKKQMTGRL